MATEHRIKAADCDYLEDFIQGVTGARAQGAEVYLVATAGCFGSGDTPGEALVSAARQRSDWSDHKTYTVDVFIVHKAFTVCADGRLVAETANRVGTLHVTAQPNPAWAAWERERNRTLLDEHPGFDGVWFELWFPEPLAHILQPRTFTPTSKED